MAAYYDVMSLGSAVNVTMIPNPSEKQINVFFGYNGVQSLWGGRRGRIFDVRGLFVGADRAAVDALRDALLAYDDGVARTLTDTSGTVWSNVVFTGMWQQTNKYMWTGGNMALPYHAVFEGRL